VLEPLQHTPWLRLCDSCNIWLHAWCRYTLIASTIFKKPAYLTNVHWLAIRDVVETWTSRPKILQKVRNSKICRLCRNVSTNFGKMSSPLQSWNYANFRHFSYLLMLFLTCRYNRQNVRWIKGVSLSHIVAVFKVSRQQVWGRSKSATFQNFDLLLQNFAT